MIQTISKRLLVLVLLILLTMLVLLCYLISFYLTIYSSIIIFILCTWSFTKFIINLLVFPGSYGFWQRIVEFHYSQELSEQTVHKLKNLKDYLKTLKDPNSAPPLPDHSIRLFQKLILTLINNFSLLESERSITQDQQILLFCLKELKNSLVSTKVNFPDGFRISIWDLIENPDQGVSLEDRENIEECMGICDKVVEMVSRNAQRSLVRGGFLLGTAEYMRADLLKRFVCEQFWIDNEGVRLDCIWISGVVSTTDSSVVIFCNPNAAYYEFAYFQTDWIEMYVGSGVNLVMWNYRGYGRSTGRPDLSKMKIDAEKIAEYLKKTKGCKVLGVHGESLGGSIASHLANSTKVNFLFADRTFASLSQTAKYNYGSFASTLFHLFGPSDSNSVQDFISADCTKLLSCDCNDLMINNLSSLKSGIAFYYFSQNPNRFPFSENELKSLIIAINDIQAIGKFTKCIDRTKKRAKKRGSIEYSTILLTLVNYLDEILYLVDSGGESFMDLFDACSELRVKNWIWVLGLWGSTPEVYSNSHTNNLQSAIEKFRVSSKELLQVVIEYEKSENEQVLGLLKHFRTVLGVLDRCREWVQENAPNEELSGKLLPLRCGHNGSFNSLERFLYEQHLQSAGIFN